MSTFIDIGSMNGEEIEWAINHEYEVHAFEPNPNCKKYLQQYEDKATINYVAAWNKDGIAKLYLMATLEPGEDGVSLVKEKTNVNKEKYIEVPTINIGRYLKELNKDITTLKINAEGAEYIILESILDNFNCKRIGIIFIEDHENYIKSDEWLKKKNEILERCEKLEIKIKDWKGI